MSEGVQYKSYVDTYRKAVMAILTHPEHGKTALKFCTERTEKTKPNITPMRLLVKHMIGVFVCLCVYACLCLNWKFAVNRFATLLESG